MVGTYHCRERPPWRSGTSKTARSRRPERHGGRSLQIRPLHLTPEEPSWQPFSRRLHLVLLRKITDPKRIHHGGTEVTENYRKQRERHQNLYGHGRRLAWRSMIAFARRRLVSA